MPEENLGIPAHEAQDWGAAAVAKIASGMVVLLLATAALAVWLYPGAIPNRMLRAPLPTTVGPPLQSSPRNDMRTYGQAQQAQLDSAGWVDREHGRVRIPIEAAMRLVARDGIAGWPGGGK